MPKIPDEVVKRVIDRAKIEDVVGDFVTLRKAGVNLTGLCPFHDDKTDGNFIVRPSSIAEKNHGNTYRCFVCDHKGGPVQFLMEHERLTFPDAIRWLGKKYNEPVDDIPLNYTPPPPRPVPPPLPVLEIPRSYVSRTIEITTERTVVFIYWLRGLPWDEDQRARLQQTLWMYCVGGWKDARVVFWQIDHNGVPRAAKLMRYLADGHRDKTQHPGWIYNQEGVRQKLDPEHHEIIKPLFGSHLLKSYPKAVINIVESEKTAIIMANYYGNLDKQLWLACGGLKHLQLDSLQPLIDQGRTIWLWPDKDGREAWQEVADKLGYDHCRVYTHFFDTCWTPADGDKADIADIAIRMMRTGDKPRKDTGDGQTPTEVRTAACSAPTSDIPPKPDNVTDEEWTEHLAIMKAIGDYDIIHPGDRPFNDMDEFTDARLRMWREILRQRCNSKTDRLNERESKTSSGRRQCDAECEGITEDV
jgi:hypothetical protein